MATKKSETKTGKSSVEYINLDLTKAYRADLVKWLEQQPDLWDLIEKAIDSGLKFSVNHDNYNDCTQATLTRFPGVDVGGITTVLVGRGPDMLKAIQALFFKHAVILDGDWENPEVRNARGVTDWS